MPSQRILELGDPLLWERSSAVEDPSSPLISSLVRDLEDTLDAFRTAKGYGRGIAAPQIGVLKRVVFIHMRPEGFWGALVNPEVSWEDAQRVELWDGCFCFPDLLVRVARAIGAHVKYVDVKGAPQTLDATGGLSELLQHEIDHLDGTLAVQRAVSPEAFCTRGEWERRDRPEHELGGEAVD